MFHGEEKSEDGHGDKIGVTAQQAEKIAVKSTLAIAGGSIVVFALIYYFLIK